MAGTTWAIKGRSGRLRCGARPAAEFRDWDATRAEGRWRITTKQHTGDPYWLEHGTSFKAVLDIGKGTVSGPAQIVSLEPLVFDMEMT